MIKQCKRIFTGITLMIMLISVGFAAPSKDLWQYWDQSNPQSNKTIDFQPWQNFLDQYLVTENGDTYVMYAKVTPQDKVALDQAIATYAHINILNYNKDQQFAYWINMYNMLTVRVILNHPNVTSIRQINAGWLWGTKVWDTPVATIMGKSVTLNDIEHRIIRPIWNDPRIHAAVNCASISCPNLSKTVYEGEKINSQLDQAFSAWVNSPKGVILRNNTLLLSQIFNWYGSDFGDARQMRDYIAKYTKNPTITNALKGDNPIGFQRYDWGLNTLD